MADIESTADGGAQIRAAATRDIVEKQEALVHVPSAEKPDASDFPTAEELNTLRRVADKIPWSVLTIAFVELCERFSYYGTTAVFTNFIQWPLPEGSTTGADYGTGQAGAMGFGQRASTGLTTYNSFWQYTMPLFGAYIADSYLGRYRTIFWALLIGIIGHVILIIAALPPVIKNPPGAMAAFILGIITMGVGTGGFKPNVNPLIVEQLPADSMRVVTLKSGERVIIDPAVTASRVYHYFYMFINIGALVGQIGMVYLLDKAFKVFVYANKGRWSLNPRKTYRNLHDGTFWSKVKPSNIAPADRPKWMTFDDAWVDEVRRGFNACAVFLWYPLFWICYNQINNNLISQAATMRLGGVPNDVLTNLNPFSLIIMIPLLDLFGYPLLRRLKIKVSPIRKIATGYFAGACAMIWAAVIQAYIYRRSDCGNYAGQNLPGTEDRCPNVDISVWAQSGSYILIAFSEIMASITSLEYAHSKAPANMRSMVQSVALFMNAVSSAIGFALVSLAEDPLLVWNYTTVAILAAIGGSLFYIQFRKLDQEEDQLNMLPKGKLNAGGVDDQVALRSETAGDKETS
ncbi:putative oligopeptide transporter [Diaporthe ampelina]|uniref:Putative oligopeptide transporter n=1 Tax=Diaporthe ampelina TaxID=1214573 RepID=A0A0G2F8V1_9PEZI|nr:putative oligopeptide transporter [Diaporthe ampelina]